MSLADNAHPAGNVLALVYISWMLRTCVLWRVAVVVSVLLVLRDRKFESSVVVLMV